MQGDQGDQRLVVRSRGASGDRGHLRWAAAIAGAAAVAHAVPLAKPLFYDDWYWIVRAMRDPTPPLLAAEGTLQRSGLAYWFSILHGAFDVDASRYHLAVFVLLLAASLAVHLVGLQIGLTRQGAFIAALVVAVHPALGPAVGWISASGSLLVVLLGSLTVWLVLRGGPTRWLALFTVSVSLLVRESAVVIPVLAVTALSVRSGSLALAHLRAAAPALLPVALFLLHRVVAGSLGVSSEAYELGVGTNVVENVARLFLEATGLGVEAEYGGAGRTLVYRVGGAAAWLAAITYAVVAARRGRWLPVGGLVWFLVCIAPVSLLRVHGMESYYLDLALVGLALFGGFVGGHLSLPGARGVAAVGAVALTASALVHFDWRWSTFGRFSARTAELTADLPPLRDPLEVPACADDPEITRDGDLYRVLLRRPDLVVRFRVSPCPGDRVVASSGTRP